MLGATLLASPESWSRQPELNRLMMDLKDYQKATDSETLLVKDESYWGLIRTFFSPQTKFVNLENGYFSPQPQSTLNTFTHEASALNDLNSYYMRNRQNDTMAAAKKALSAFSGLPEDEFTICRNTTEALDTIIHGYPWKPGDEVILSHQDYGSMQAAFKQEARRRGIKLNYIELPLNPGSDLEIIDVYEAAITPKTKMMLVTHLINLTGQILPAKALTEMAHSHGVEVMLDSAHSFAHIEFNTKELGVDYMGTSLHKWLCCPLGLGLMYIRKDHIEKVWPLFGDNDRETDDIRKFEHWGTRPVSAIATIPEAIKFHNSIGGKLKKERLSYLKEAWLKTASQIGNKFASNTPKDHHRSCAIANFAIDGIKPNDLAKVLMEEHNIFTVAINSPEVNGVRVTPHLYTSMDEIQQLSKAIDQLCS